MMRPNLGEANSAACFKVEALLAELQLQAVCQLLDSNLARNKLLACQHPSRMA